MADRNQLKIADTIDVADDDPFAELTRIMGFDPRQPVKQAPQCRRRSRPADEDFSIDLEKELMGEFEAEEADDDRGQDAPVDAPREAARVEAAYEDEIEFDLAEDFHEELAAAAEELQPEPAVSDDNSYETGIDLDFADHFDDALVASVEKDIALAHGWSQTPSGGDPEQAVAADVYEPVVFDAVADEQLDAHFDAALADVDMDFRMDPETADEPRQLWRTMKPCTMRRPPLRPRPRQIITRWSLWTKTICIWTGITFPWTKTNPFSKPMPSMRMPALDRSR